MKNVKSKRNYIIQEYHKFSIENFFLKYEEETGFKLGNETKRPEFNPKVIDANLRIMDALVDNNFLPSLIELQDDETISIKKIHSGLTVAYNFFCGAGVLNFVKQIKYDFYKLWDEFTLNHSPLRFYTINVEELSEISLNLKELKQSILKSKRPVL